MIKSELIHSIADKQRHLCFNDIELAVNLILDHMAEELSKRGRIEIRGFGVFIANKRKAVVGRNPKTGKPVAIPEKYVPHFKAGKPLLKGLNN
jgi:integration host factor subunit beta